MSNLYPARRIPQIMVLIGSAFMAGALLMAVGHFGFGISGYNRDTGQPLSDLAIAILVLAIGSIGVLLAVIGRAVLRAASRYNRDETIGTNGS